MRKSIARLDEAPTGVVAARLVPAGGSGSRGGRTQSLQVSRAPGEAALSGRGLLISGAWPALLPSPGMGNRVGGRGTVVLQSQTEILGCSKPPPDLASERQDTAHRRRSSLLVDLPKSGSDVDSGLVHWPRTHPLPLRPSGMPRSHLLCRECLMHLAQLFLLAWLHQSDVHNLRFQLCLSTLSLVTRL